MQGPPKLKQLNLSQSFRLKRLPDLSSTTKLKSLELCGCESLLEIPSSIQNCKKLINLNLENCKILKTLQSLILLKFLSTLCLSRCLNLKLLPDIPRGIKDLKLYESGLEKWPLSVPSLDNLAVFYVAFCKNLRSVPSLVHWKSLRHIHLTGCSSLKLLPEIPRRIEYLFIEGSGLEEWSSSIRYLNELSLFLARHCKNLTSLPRSVHLNFLGELDFTGCSSLKMIPDITGNNLRKLVLNQTGIEELPSTIGSLSSLLELEMQACIMLQTLPRSLCELKWLTKLILCGCSNLSYLPSLCGLLSLEELNLENCKRLQAVQGLPWQGS